MIALLHNDCDGYPSVWADFENNPTVEDLKKVFINYYEEEKALEIAEELLQYGECTLNNCSVDEFTLETICSK
jgi:hypothetical protein